MKNGSKLLQLKNLNRRPLTSEKLQLNYLSKRAMPTKTNSYLAKKKQSQPSTNTYLPKISLQLTVSIIWWLRNPPRFSQRLSKLIQSSIHLTLKHLRSPQRNTQACGTQSSTRIRNSGKIWWTQWTESVKDSLKIMNFRNPSELRSSIIRLQI